MARLTIPDEQTFAEFTVVTSTSVFPITFSVFAKADLTVLVDGVAMDQSDFSFSGAVLEGGGYDGGTVTLNAAVDDVTVRIERDVQPARTSNFAPASTTPVGSVDQALNRATAILQDLQRKKANRPYGAAGKYLAFDSEGNEVASAGTGADAGLRTDLAEEGGSGLLGWIQAGIGAILRTIRDKLRERVSVKDFGAVGDSITDETAAIYAMHAYAVTKSAAGNAIRIVWPAGRYSYATSPNWGEIDRLDMHFEGEVWLAKYGAGPAFIVDGGASGTGLHGLSITGYPRVFNDSANHHGIYLRALHNSLLQLRCSSAGTSYAALYGEWLVDNQIDFTVTGLEGQLPSIPGKGIHLTLRGAGEDSSYNQIRLRISGYDGGLIPVGVLLETALGNVFYGTIQNCALGFKDTVRDVGAGTGSWHNKLFAMDLEANTADAEVHGLGTAFLYCDMEVGATFTADSKDGTAMGGTTQSVTVASGAQDTLLSSFTYNRLGLPGTGTLTDAGTRTRFRDLRNGTDGIVHDAPVSRTAQTVGASPYTYTNTSGNQQRVLVYGGTVSSLVFSRLSGDPLPVSGQFVLEPGDALVVTYSSAPAVVVCT
jgi:hypothetical protein